MTYSNFFKKVVLIFVSLLLLLFVVEFSLRILGYFFSRMTNLDAHQKNQTFNIFCLGDSFTYGLGVETAYTYPKQLETLLNNSKLSKRFKVFNLAVPGSNSSQHLKYLDGILKKYKRPDLIIVLTGANDAWNLADSNIYKFIVTKSKMGSIKIKLRILLANLRTYKMLEAILLNSTDPFLQIRRSESIDVGILKNLLEDNLTQLAQLAQSNKIKIIFQNYPRGDVYEENITQRVALRFNIPFVDNAAVFKERLKELSFKDLFIYDNSHPNGKGYKIIAEGLFKAVKEEVLKQ